MGHRATRRRFLKSSAAVVAAPWFVPARAFGANDRLQIAGIGIGGKGKGDLESTSAGEQVVAICDVDDRTLNSAAEKYPSARRYSDWRRLLDQNDIDAVTVSTPDHMHAPIAVSAMQLGKHVYVQKPLAHTVYEARRMRELAAQHGVVSQMGNQGHSGSGYRTVVQLVQSGAIGRIREAHAWSDRPIWPQAIERPERSDPVPDYLQWDLWLGVAAERPFVGPEPDSRRDRGAYHPFNWRGWLDFGVGALGDMGCHIIDPVVWSCQLGPPIAVWSDGPPPNRETYPEWGVIHYEFAGTAQTASDTFRLTWYDGRRQPDVQLARLPEGEKLPTNGSLYVGEKGVILCPHGGAPRLLPAEDFAGHTIERVAGDDHYRQWSRACKGEGRTTSHFDYAGPLTETVLLGTIAIRFPGERLAWDAAALRFPNHPEADRFVHKSYREGWGVPALVRPGD